MSIKIKGFELPRLLVSTIMGHSGNGREMPLGLYPPFWPVRRAILQTGTTVIAKSSTYMKHTGFFRWWNPFTWKYIRRLQGMGMLNAYGLTNHGVEVNALTIASATNKGYNIIPSFYPQFAKGRTLAIQETIQAIAIYCCWLGGKFRVLEFNFSCPNSEEEIRKNMKDALACVKATLAVYPELCLIAKISIVHPHEFAQDLVKAGVDIIHAINTIPYDLVYPDGPPSPLQAVGGGGVSGGPAFKLALDYNQRVREMIPGTPLIMGCGVMSSYNADYYFRNGADAVSICTVCKLEPAEAIKIIKEHA